jgi:hypothetical protein
MAYFVSITEFADRTTHWLDVSVSQPLVVTRNGTPSYRVFGYGKASTPPRELPLAEEQICEVKTRDLSRATHSVLEGLEYRRCVGVVTKHGNTRALIDTVDQADLDAYAAAVFANSPAYVASRQKADIEFAAGKTRTLDEFFDELD